MRAHLWSDVSLALLAAATLFCASSAVAQSTPSTQVTWTCAGADCPWGGSLSGQAAVWPAGTTPVMNRYDYALSHGIYLPGSEANGATITIESGSASVYAGLPSGPHSLVTSISAGGSYFVQGIGDTEVVSIQSGGSFTYAIAFGPPPAPPPPPAGDWSELVTWNCTGANCPWGSSTSGDALVWPAGYAALSQRYDYTTSSPIYLPADVANLVTVTVESGSAGLYAGPPGGAQTQIGGLVGGESQQVQGLAPGDVLSVQSSAPFTFSLELGTPPESVPPVGDWSTLVTWTCAGANCPWGASTTGEALVWPVDYTATSQRYDYTTSSPIYLPADIAHLVTITIESGSAGLYAGAPGGVQTQVGGLAAGESARIETLAPGDVLSVQSSTPFTYSLDLAEYVPPPPPPPPPVLDPSLSTSGVSSNTVWSCTGANCPWGTSVAAHALEWPAAVSPSSGRYGYTTSRAVYLPAAAANPGLAIRVDSGSASIFRGTTSSDQTLATLAAGQVYVVPALGAGEVLSVESSNAFSYTLGTPTDLVPPPPPPPPIDPNDPVPTTGLSSQYVTWTCTGTNCPWGQSSGGDAAVWGAGTTTVSTRYDYVTSAGIYLAAADANRLTFTVGSGSASLYAGTPNGAHSLVANVNAGQSYTVSGLASGQVLSAQSGAPFTYGVLFGDPVLPDPNAPPSGDPGSGPDAINADESWPPGIGPVVSGAVSSVDATWECDAPGCTAAPGIAAVIDWPNWAAYTSNGAADPADSRSVFDGDGTPLYPFMGPWADGCIVKAEAGEVTVIEWERGAPTWRETLLATGQSHQIMLQGSENGAVIESGPSGQGFAVSLSGCEPAAVPKEAEDTGPVLEFAGASQETTWTCAGSDCPWGNQVAAQAAVWPAEASPLAQRYDYALSNAAYLSADVANGIQITMDSGEAYVFVGTPQRTDSVVAYLSAGQSHVIQGLTPGNVLSIESESAFTYHVGPPPPPDPNAPVAIQSVAAHWYCNNPGCDSPPWTGRVIDWNHWSSYQSNARSGLFSGRAVYDAITAAPLHPYMGEWADGCTITAVTGRALIIEWERSTDVWRETYLDPGESHTITFVGPEDGALIESNEINDPFSILLEGCEPQPLP